jgi:hypothetical protein
MIPPPGGGTSGRLDVSALLRQPGGRRAAGQLTELARQVRLVVVAALSRHIGERAQRARGGLPLQQPPGPVETDNPGRGLRGQASGLSMSWMPDASCGVPFGYFAPGGGRSGCRILTGGAAMPHSWPWPG